MPANQGLTAPNWRPKGDFPQNVALKPAQPRTFKFNNLAGLTEFIEFDANLPEVESYPRELRHDLAKGIAQTLIRPEHLVPKEGTDAVRVVQEFVDAQLVAARQPGSLPEATTPRYAYLWSEEPQVDESPIPTVFVVTKQPLKLVS